MRKRRMPNLVVALLLACGGGLLAAAPSDAAHPPIGCPAAPDGGTNPSGVGEEVIGPDEVPGRDQEQITCDYYTTGGRHLLVDVDYALPADLNPLNDFVFACGHQNTVPWNATDRKYLISSTSYWATAAFFDFTKQITA